MLPCPGNNLAMSSITQQRPPPSAVSANNGPTMMTYNPRSSGNQCVGVGVGGVGGGGMCNLGAGDNGGGAVVRNGGGGGGAVEDPLKIHVQLPNGVVPVAPQLPFQKPQQMASEYTLQQNATFQPSNSGEGFHHTLPQLGPQQSPQVMQHTILQHQLQQNSIQQTSQFRLMPQQQQQMQQQQQQIQQQIPFQAQNYAQQQYHQQGQPRQLQPQSLSTPQKSFHGLHLQLQSNLPQVPSQPPLQTQASQIPPPQPQTHAQISQPQQLITLPQSVPQMVQQVPLQQPLQQVPPQQPLQQAPFQPTTNQSQPQPQAAEIQKIFQALPPTTQQQIHVKLLTAKLHQVQQMIQQLQAAPPTPQQQQDIAHLSKQQQYLEANIAALQRPVSKMEPPKPGTGTLTSERTVPSPVNMSPIQQQLQSPMLFRQQQQQQQHNFLVQQQAHLQTQIPPQVPQPSTVQQVPLPARPARQRRQNLRSRDLIDSSESDTDEDEFDEEVKSVSYSLRKRRRVPYKDTDEGNPSLLQPKKGKGKKSTQEPSDVAPVLSGTLSTPVATETSITSSSTPVVNTSSTATTSSCSSTENCVPTICPSPPETRSYHTRYGVKEHPSPTNVESAIIPLPLTEVEKDDRGIIEKIIAHTLECVGDPEQNVESTCATVKKETCDTEHSAQDHSAVKPESVQVDPNNSEMGTKEATPTRVTSSKDVTTGIPTMESDNTQTTISPQGERPREHLLPVEQDSKSETLIKSETIDTKDTHGTCVLKTVVKPETTVIPEGSTTTIKKETVEQNPAITKPVMKYLVKWKDKSYVHCEWLTEAQVLRKEGKQGSAKIKRYWTKRGNDSDSSSGNEDTTDELFPVEYTQVDRIFACGEEEDGGRPMYLVKWAGLPYTDSTWEYAEDFKDDKKIEEYRKFHVLPCEPPPPPLPSRLWVKMEQTPEYKGGNTLRPYQLEGLNWLIFCWCQGRGSILADEMGLGKTVQVVAFFEHLRVVQLLPGPFLVVAPLTTIGHWVKELQEWTDMNVVVYLGNKDNREYIKKYEWFYLDHDGQPLGKQIKFTVLVTTYEMVMTDANDLARIQWQVIVVDEAHRMKNAQSKLLTALKLIKGYHRILLTGTPIQNNTKELWSLLNFIEPSNFASQEGFLQEFGNLHDEQQVKNLQEVLHPHLLRRMKSDVEKSIPPKEETVVEVELTVLQKQYYRAILEKNREFLNKGCANNANVPNLLNIVMQLRKVCNHPFLIPGVEEKEAGPDKSPEDYNNALTRSSGKLVLLDKLLPKLLAAKHKILIFSQLKGVLDLLEKYLQFKDYLYERLDGSVKANDRQMAIERFCNPEYQRFIFLLSTRAGGFGINLAAADTVVIYDSDWNPQNDVQAQARCHRIGQKKDVKIYRLLSRNTYEMIMFDRASKKLGLDQVVLHTIGSNNNHTPAAGKQVSSAAALSKEEINDMLRYGAYDLFRESDTESASASFCEDDIENILVKRSSRVVWKEDNQGSMFSKATFHLDDQTASLDVKDPHFWEKVLPQAATAKSLLDQITNLVAGKSETDQKVWLESKKDSFLHNLQRLVEAMVTGYNEGKGKIPQDRDILRNLLLFCASHTTTLFPSEQPKILEWLSDIDFSRRKRKVHKVDSPEQQSPQKPTVDILSLDWLSPNQPKALFEAFLLYCRPCWKQIQTRATGYSHHPQHELSDIVCTFLQQCISFALPYDQQMFTTVLQHLTSHKKTDKLSRNKPRRKKQPDLNAALYSVPQTEVTLKLSELADRMRLLEQLNTEISANPNNYTVLDFGRRLAPWWDVTHDRDLLLGTFRHGWGCYPTIFADSELCFVKSMQQYKEGPQSEIVAEKGSTIQSPTANPCTASKPISTATSLTPWPSDEIFHQHLKFLLECIRQSKETAATHSRRKRASASASAVIASTAAFAAGSSVIWEDTAAVRPGRRRNPKVGLYDSDSQSAMVRKEDSQWTLYNDSACYDFKFGNECDEKNAYMFFYQYRKPITGDGGPWFCWYFLRLFNSQLWMEHCHCGDRSGSIAQGQKNSSPEQMLSE
ncbi:chromodomain helicase DNA binding protein [Pelomyxa schiedti]|nr:chromodomain helicase DNA binding protein [Pelomyxa schiedti]